MTAGLVLCVFCGSSRGFESRFAEEAAKVGALLARADIDIVYGGGHVGLMGVLADAALAEGGRVEGVIPRSLVARELAHTGLTALHVVESMHERKAKMADLADAFIALPGGIGTLEEIFEQWTWAQLAIHSKPCGILNFDGYFGPLQAMVTRMIEAGFLGREDADLLQFADDIETLLPKLGDRIAPDPPLSIAATEEGA
jgi:uncharacterized protein (TIGR00730 family)